MESKEFDAYPGESEVEYEARKNGEARALGELMSMLMITAFYIIKIAVLCGLFVFAGFLLSQKLWGEESGKFKLIGTSILFTYFIFCLVYFFKGIIIGLRARNRKLWMLPWAISVLLCCIAPAFMVKVAVTTMFNIKEQQEIWCIGLSWAAFVISLLYIYNIYQFKTPGAPKILYWSYRLGLKVSL